MWEIAGRGLLVFSLVRIAAAVRGYTFTVLGTLTSLVTKRHVVRQLVVVAALFFLGLALVLPAQSSRGETQTQGHDVLVVLDVSQSMQVQDVSYASVTTDRLTAAKTAIAELVAKVPYNRRGLVVFAGEAVGISPLTADAELFLTFLAGVDHQNVTTQGTNIADALLVAANRFDTGDVAGRIILLVSDGGDEAVEISDGVIQQMEDMQINIMMRGVGSEQGGYIPEGRDPFGNIIYKQFQGEQVVSSYRETALRSVANKTDGILVRLTDIDSIRQVVRRFETIEKRTVTVDASTQSLPLARRPLVVSLLFVVLYCIALIPRRRRYGEEYAERIVERFYRLKRSLLK